MAALAVAMVIVAATTACYGPVAPSSWQGTLHCDSHSSATGSSTFDWDGYVDIETPTWVMPGDTVPIHVRGYAYSGSLSVDAAGLDDAHLGFYGDSTDTAKVTAQPGSDVVLSYSWTYTSGTIGGPLGGPIQFSVHCVPAEGVDPVIVRIPVVARPPETTSTTTAPTP